MSVVEIEKAIEELPPRKLHQLFSHLRQKIEDWLDYQAAMEARREGKYKPLEQVLKELNERRRQPKSRKSSSLHRRRKTS